MRRVVIISILSIVPQLLLAQWSFTVTVSKSGNCSSSLGGRISAGVLEAYAQHLSRKIYSTQQECENFRASANFVSSGYGCTVRVVATPCRGHGGASGSVDILGPSQGSSFYSNNGFNEIQNWNDDHMERMIALNPEFQNTSPTELSMGDEDTSYARTRGRETAFVLDPSKLKTFRSLNIGEDGMINTHSDDFISPKVVPANDQTVLSYLENIDRSTEPRFPLENPDDYFLWIKDQFKKVTGNDIESLMSKMSRTAAENEVVRNYREFEARLLKDAKARIDEMLATIDRSVEKKQVDMAILALDSYGADEKGYLFNTNYRRVDLDKIPLSDPIRDLANKLTSCNLTTFDTGFNAVLYYNDKTNEYTIAFEGSAWPSLSLSSENTLASKISPAIDFDANTNEYVVNVLDIELRIPQDTWNDWGKNNALQAAGRIASQFTMAKEIGDVINSIPELKDLNINFTGHSLGGALASIAGLNTGRPTYTYNAEGVSDKILSSFGLLEKKQGGEYQITAYHTDNDILTSAQKWAQGENQSPQEYATGRAREQNAKMSGYVTGNTVLSDAVDILGEGELSTNPVAWVVDPEHKKNNYVATAIGTEVNIGNLNTYGDAAKSVAAGIVVGGVTLWATRNPKTAIKYGKNTAEFTDKALAHRMEPMVRFFSETNKDVQGLWDSLNQVKQSMNGQMGNTRMRSMEYIYITTE